ncbi:hypothetical protein [Pigmentibacter ruber]|uniref:hypothetical protein n=1 Tax=Pigmentibacter ruber TaxID=2683196 RepID=UPI00131EB64D|nr:hypothetical protein [Pigmentibacter ruber]
MKKKKEIFLCKILENICNNKNLSCQTGQILFSSLFLIIFSLVMSIFFLFTAECYIRNYSNVNIARNSVLMERTEIANILNEISINNYLIFHAVKFAEYSFLQASELSMYNSYSQKYWETFKKINNEGVFANFFDNANEKNIKLNFETFKLSSARNLSIAKSLSFKNIILFNKLPKKISSHFKFSGNNTTFCMALNSSNEIFTKPGFFSFPILERFYSFHFDRNECEIAHRRINYTFFLPKLPSLTFAAQDKFLFLEKNSTISSALHYSLLYVPYVNKENFLVALETESPKKVAYKNSYTVFFNLVMKSLNIRLDKKILADYSKTIYATVIHPNYYCNEKFSAIISTDNNFQNRNNLQCFIGKNDFLFSFFLPNWAATISFEKDQSANEF